MQQKTCKQCNKKCKQASDFLWKDFNEQKIKEGVVKKNRVPSFMNTRTTIPYWFGLYSMYKPMQKNVLSKKT